MNFTKIEGECPEAYAQWRKWNEALSDFDGTDGRNCFFDELGIVAVPTYYPDHPKPWGWEVWTAEGRFVRQEGAYVDRNEAQQAAWTQAFAELNRLLIAGNYSH